MTIIITKPRPDCRQTHARKKNKPTKNTTQNVIFYRMILGERRYIQTVGHKHNKMIGTFGIDTGTEFDAPVGILHCQTTRTSFRHLNIIRKIHKIVQFRYLVLITSRSRFSKYTGALNIMRSRMYLQ